MEPLRLLYSPSISSILSFQILKSFIFTDLEILKKLYLFYIRPKIEHNTPLWYICCIKDINQLESIQRKITRIIFNRCNISYISYIDRLTKLNMKTLEYKRVEYDLITFFKLVNKKTTIDSQTFFLIYINNYSLRGKNRKYTCKYNLNNVGWQNYFVYCLV